MPDALALGLEFTTDAVLEVTGFHSTKIGSTLGEILYKGDFLSCYLGTKKKRRIIHQVLGRTFLEVHIDFPREAQNTLTGERRKFGRKFVATLLPFRIAKHQHQRNKTLHIIQIKFTGKNTEQLEKGSKSANHPATNEIFDTKKCCNVNPSTVSQSSS